MEFETYFTTSNPKTREIIETYRHIRSVYQRIKAATEQHPRRKAISGATSTITIGNLHFTCLTATARF